MLKCIPCRVVKDIIGRDCTLFFNKSTGCSINLSGVVHLIYLHGRAVGRRCVWMFPEYVALPCSLLSLLAFARPVLRLGCAPARLDRRPIAPCRAPHLRVRVLRMFARGGGGNWLTIGLRKRLGLNDPCRIPLYLLVFRATPSRTTSQLRLSVSR